MHAKIILTASIATPDVASSHPAAQLGSAMRASGCALQPIVVRVTGIDADGFNCYELVDGGLTYQAAIAADLDTIDAYVLGDDTDADVGIGLLAQIARYCRKCWQVFSKLEKLCVNSTRRWLWLCLRLKKQRATACSAQALALLFNTRLAGGSLVIHDSLRGKAHGTHKTNGGSD